MTSQTEPASTHIAFQTSNPDGETTAQIAPDAQLPDLPVWSIDAVSLGVARSSPSYLAHLEATIGSSFDWSDEFRFDKQTGRLSSLVLKTPEAGALDPGIAHSWLALPNRIGVPTLTSRESGFHIDPLDLRYVTERANALVAASADLPPASPESLRLSLGQDIDLLIHRGRYAGWILSSPLKHLASPGHEPKSDEGELHEPLRLFLNIVIEPNIERMSDEDPELRGRLVALRQRVCAVADARARTLERAIERVLETFYPS